MWMASLITTMCRCRRTYEAPWHVYLRHFLKSWCTPERDSLEEPGPLSYIRYESGKILHRLTYATNCDHVSQRLRVCASPFTNSCFDFIDMSPIPSYRCYCTLRLVSRLFAECQRDTDGHVGLSPLGRVGHTRGIHRRRPNAGCRSGLICVTGASPVRGCRIRSTRVQYNSRRRAARHASTVR